MKKYIKEIVILLIQLGLFYIFPKSMVVFEPMGMVLLMLLATFVLGIVLASISKNKIKYLYPIVIAILFLPTVFIYYNESALVHSIWYLVVSSVGMAIGTIINILINIKKK